MNDKGDARLRAIEGGLYCRLRHGSLQIVASPANSPPFEVDAVALEEDTYLVMSADRQVKDPQQHPVRLRTEVINFKAAPVGSVLIQGENPLRFLAIVHDLNCRPTWQKKWIDSALREIFQEAEKRRLTGIGLQPLGTIYGQLTLQLFVDLLGPVLLERSLRYLRKIWLIAPLGTNQTLINLLRYRLNPQMS